MSALFPEGRYLSFVGTSVRRGEQGFPVTVTVTECQRCAAWVSNTPRHEAWHRSVDTDQTIDVSHHYTATGLPEAAQMLADVAQESAQHWKDDGFKP